MNIYEKASRQYQPSKLKCLFIAESPPAYLLGEKPRYFYFKDYVGKQSLFGNIMNVMYPNLLPLCTQTLTKTPCLERFCNDGFFLIDAVEYPINSLSESKRDLEIQRSLPLILSNLSQLIKNRSLVQIILIKKNVYRILRPPLQENGYLLPQPSMIPFPGSGNQVRFRKCFEEVLRTIGFRHSGWS